MKIHITNNYGFINDKRIGKQQSIVAKAAHDLGYIEHGIYNYYVESDSDRELNNRIEGITVSVEKGDTVFVQLPTGNGPKFDEEFICELNYKEANIVLVWHSLAYYEKTKFHLSILSNYDIIPSELYGALEVNELKIKKMLVNGCYCATKRKKDTVDTVHIGMGVHDKTGKYSSWLGITIESVVEHTNANVHFHILHDKTLSEENKKKLQYIIRKSNNKISFHYIDESIFQSCSNNVGIYTIGALFRILLPEVCLELDKIIYLDSDLLVNCDIYELWKKDISKYCLAAVKDKEIAEGRIGSLAVRKNGVEKERYFNSGVILMNLNEIRKKGCMKDLVIEYLEKNMESDLPDQDALNVIYGNSTLLLEAKWNRFVRHVREKKEIELQNCIYHYVGNRCVLYFETQMDLLYLETANHTPWKEELTRVWIRDSIGRQNVRINNLEKILHELTITKKKLIFYGYETYLMDNMYDLLSVTGTDSYRVLEIPDNSEKLPCRELKEIENEKTGDFIIFVAPEADNGRAIDNLNKMGLKLQKDYFVIPNILGQLEGGYI